MWYHPWYSLHTTPVDICGIIPGTVCTHLDSSHMWYHPWYSLHNTRHSYHNPWYTICTTFSTQSATSLLSTKNNLKFRIQTELAKAGVDAGLCLHCSGPNTSHIRGMVASASCKPRQWDSDYFWDSVVVLTSLGSGRTLLITANTILSAEGPEPSLLAISLTEN